MAKTRASLGKQTSELQEDNPVRRNILFSTTWQKNIALNLKEPCITASQIWGGIWLNLQGKIVEKIIKHIQADCFIRLIILPEDASLI